MWVLAVFILAIIWILRGFFLIVLFTELLGDGSIAMFAAVLLFIIPSKKQNGRVLTGESQKTHLGACFTIRGGLALAGSIAETGVDLWIGEMLSGVGGVPLILMITIVAVLILF